MQPHKRMKDLDIELISIKRNGRHVGGESRCQTWTPRTQRCPNPQPGGVPRRVPRSHGLRGGDPTREKEPISLCRPGEQMGSPHDLCTPTVSPGSALWHQCGCCLRTNSPQEHGARCHGSRPLPKDSPLPQVVADGCLVEPFAFIQELGDVSTRVLQQVVLY